MPHKFDILDPALRRRVAADDVFILSNQKFMLYIKMIVTSLCSDLELCFIVISVDKEPYRSRVASLQNQAQEMGIHLNIVAKTSVMM